MNLDQIIQTIKDKKSDPNKLFIALFYTRQRIEYCKYHNIDMFTDPLLSKVLFFINI